MQSASGMSPNKVDDRHAGLKFTLQSTSGMQSASENVLQSQSIGTSSKSSGPLARSSKMQRPLRAVSVGPCLVRGGAEQWLIYLNRFLDPRRVQIVRAIATNPEFDDPAFLVDVPIPVEIGSAEAIQRAARESDVMLCWGIELDDMLGTERPKLCVYIAHGEGDWTRLMLSRSQQSFDHVVAVSNRVRERVCNGYSTSVIYNGVDTARLGTTRCSQSIRREYGFTDRDFVLGYVGRFSAEKQAHLLIEAAAQLPARFKVLFVGWGSGRQSLLELANECIPGRYAFASADRYLGDYYRMMDAFCLTSNQEGFSLALLEAMWCERTVIVTPVGCVPEIIRDRVNGIVVEDNGPSIAAAVKLVDEFPNWARGVAAEGRLFADRHGHALRMASQYEDLLESLWLDRYGVAA